MVSLPIYLVGMPGAGKSTLLEGLRKATGLRCADLDAIIEREQGDTVAGLFERLGEEGFRQLEADALRRITDVDILATGGGTPCFLDNLSAMSARGSVIYLEASPERLHERLTLYGATRPAVRGLEAEALRRYIADLLKRRTPYYEQAAYTFDANSLDTSEQITETTQLFITQYLI